MINPKNQEEFKSLGIETVRRREAAVASGTLGKAREAREWISNEETRIAPKRKECRLDRSNGGDNLSNNGDNLSRFSSPAFPSLEPHLISFGGLEHRRRNEIAVRASRPCAPPALPTHRGLSSR